MHLGMKSYLKSNRNHNAKQTLRSLVFKVSKPSDGEICTRLDYNYDDYYYSLMLYMFSFSGDLCYICSTPKYYL